MIANAISEAMILSISAERGAVSLWEAQRFNPPDGRSDASKVRNAGKLMEVLCLEIEKQH